MTAWWITFGLLAALLLMLLRLRKISRNLREAKSLNKQLRQQLAKARLDPHFMFNALSSIQYFISAGNRESSLRYLSRFATLLRETMDAGDNRPVPLAEDIRLLGIYLELESLRFNGKLAFEVGAAPDVDLQETEIPLLLVQPFVENAIIHGLAPMQGEGRVTVHYQDGGAFTTCTVTDNGIGRQAAMTRRKERHAQRPSRGMDLASERISLWGNLPSGIDPIQIIDLVDDQGKAAGTEVIIRIPKSKS